MAIDKCDNAALCDIVAGATVLILYRMDGMLEEGNFQYEEDNVNDLIATLCKSYHCLCTLLTSSW